jgi:hypothetical protein
MLLHTISDLEHFSNSESLAKMNDLAANSEVSSKARVDATPQAAGNKTRRDSIERTKSVRARL